MPKNILQSVYLYLLGYRDDISLGKCFHYGQHAKKDLRLARVHYLEAAKQGKAEPFCQLSKLAEEESLLGESFYYLGRSQECLNQWQEALTSYKRAGTENYAAAWYRAGLLFKKDRLSTPEQTIKKDLLTELAWYRKGAAAYSAHALDELVTLSNSEAKAALHLAQMYEKGELGNKKVLSNAVDYYDKASKLGDPIAAYRLGQLYEFGEETFNNNQRKAFDYYLISAKKRDKKSLESLERVAPKLNDPILQLQLAEVYENNFYNQVLALDCYKQLADKGHKIALDRMNSLANRSVSCANTLANSYESSNLPHKAFTYYLIVAKKKDEKALEGLERVVAKINDAKLQLQLAEIYEDSFGKKELALKIFKELADKGDKLATDRMNALANKHASCAYELAKSYENEDKLNHQTKGYEYYVLAMRNNHPEAKSYLTSLAESGNTEAQYVLGFLYYHFQGNFSEAIHWCLLATEQKHDKATAYINNTIFPSQHYLVLASSYEKGEKVSRNKEKALYFYEKALIEKNKEAAFRLGQCYQFDNEEKAFAYFIQAAQWGHTEALCYLERLATELDSTTQLQLANLYRDPPFNNPYKALHWSRQALIASDANTSFSDEVLIKLIEDTEKIISFENLNLFARKMAHDPKLTVPSFLLK